MTNRRVSAKSGGRSRAAQNKRAVRKSKRRNVSANSRKPASGRNGKAVVGAPKPLPKTKLTLEDLETFRQLLMEKRRQLVGDVGSMESEALDKSRTTATGDLSMMPIHMADIGTDNYEQDFTISLIEGERDQLKEIDAALQRIKEGTYGICMATHKPISKARLKAKPWARFCVAYKRKQEASQRR